MPPVSSAQPVCPDASVELEHDYNVRSTESACYASCSQQAAVSGAYDGYSNTYSDTQYDMSAIHAANTGNYKPTWHVKWCNI